LTAAADEDFFFHQEKERRSRRKVCIKMGYWALPRLETFGLDLDIHPSIYQSIYLYREEKKGEREHKRAYGCRAFFIGHDDAGHGYLQGCYSCSCSCIC
jgi:hypothetical protein